MEDLRALAAFGLDRLEQRANDGHPAGSQANYDRACTTMRDAELVLAQAASHPLLVPRCRLR